MKTMAIICRIIQPVSTYTFQIKNLITEILSGKQNFRILMAIVALSMTLCSCRDPKSVIKDEISHRLDRFELFMEKLSRQNYVAISDIIGITRQWYCYRDSIRAELYTNATSDSLLVQRFNSTDDSIRVILGRLVDETDRNFNDYISVVEKLSLIDMDSVSQEYINIIIRTYDKADSIPVYSGNYQRTLRLYETTHDETLYAEFNTQTDILRFLLKEDVAFRSFLNHLSQMGNQPLDGISTKSKNISLKILSLADNEYVGISKSEIVLLLTMRQNRRVLQNAIRCINDIRNHKITDENQQTAYLWMILQPWMTIDGFAYALLTSEQVNLLKQIASDTPKILKMLPSVHFPIDVNELPALLIKYHIENNN